MTWDRKVHTSKDQPSVKPQIIKFQSSHGPSPALEWHNQPQLFHFILLTNGQVYSTDMREIIPMNWEWCRSKGATMNKICLLGLWWGIRQEVKSTPFSPYFPFTTSPNRLIKSLGQVSSSPSTSLFCWTKRRVGAVLLPILITGLYHYISLYQSNDETMWVSAVSEQ